MGERGRAKQQKDQDNPHHHRRPLRRMGLPFCHAIGGCRSRSHQRRRSAIEPVIGHLKAEGHLGRCYLKGRAGDAANVILSAVGHNFRRILAWLRNLLRLILIALWRTFAIQIVYNPAY
jgi:hypothetical protein